MSFVYFAILIGVLIFVHEFGHFLFAKLFGVKVLRFSIGFGPRIVRFEYGETEYVVCWLPLGGYVQMYGHTFESMDRVDDEDRDRALMGKPVWQRSLITFAGPLFNFILPAVIFFSAGLGTTKSPPSVVGSVYPETPAAEAGLEPGDRIVAIDGESVSHFRQVVGTVSEAYNQQLTLTVERSGERKKLQVTPEKKSSTDFLGLNDRTRGMLGIHLGTPGTTIAIDDPAGPAAESGLQNFDRVMAVDGERVRKFHELQSRIQNSDGQPTEVLVLRRHPIDVGYAQFFRQEAETVTVEPERQNGEYALGLDTSEMYITQVDSESPAADAGLQGGDEILSVDRRRYGNWRMMVQSIEGPIKEKIRKQRAAGEEADADLTFDITYERGGETHTTTLSPEVIKYSGQRSQEGYRIYTGWGNFSDRVMPDDISVPFGQRLAFAARDGVEKTWQFTEMTATALLRLVQGRISLDTLGGPIMIGELAAQAGRAGAEQFFRMMALISINLGLINLAPIPVLDGGHLMFYAIEAVRRRPLSYRTRQIATYIGFAIVVFLMLLAFKNDIQYNWQSFVEWLEAW